jgi:hypothetical protein
VTDSGYDVASLSLAGPAGTAASSLLPSSTPGTNPTSPTTTDTTPYGKAETMAWDRMHPSPAHR